jgi:hypothetical protein
MKKIKPIILLCLHSLFAVAQFPTIQTTTIIPASPAPTDIVKIVTRVTTPNQGIIVDLIHTVSHNPKEINLRPCYWQGMLPSIQTHIDTFVVGQLQAGVYTIKHKAFMSTTQQHCTKVDSNMVVTTLTVGGLSTGLEELDQMAFSIYPNPVNDKLFIKGYKNGDEAEIYHLDGRLVKKVKIDETGSLDVSSLSKGIYFLQGRDQEHVSRIKFIKE